MKKIILAVCKIHDALLEKHASKIIYRPHLAEFSPQEWEDLIKSVKPDVVLYGTIHFTKEMMETWRKYKPEGTLHIVRKGISLGRCDLAAADKLSIEVSNLPGVNTVFVANFMKQFLFQENTPTDRIAIIGTGTIGQKVIFEAASHDMPITLHSKTLKS